MKNNAIPRILMAAIPTVIVCFLLGGVSAIAQSDAAQSGDRACSNQTLFGDYASAIDGLILPAPGVTLPIRGINMVHFDGKGNSTQVDSLILNGSPISDWT